MWRQIVFSLIAIGLILWGCWEFSQGRLTGLILFALSVGSLGIAENGAVNKN